MPDATEDEPGGLSTPGNFADEDLYSCFVWAADSTAADGTAAGSAAAGSTAAQPSWDSPRHPPGHERSWFSGTVRAYKFTYLDPNPNPSPNPNPNPNPTPKPKPHTNPQPYPEPQPSPSP